MKDESDKRWVDQTLPLITRKQSAFNHALYWTKAGHTFTPSQYPVELRPDAARGFTEAALQLQEAGRGLSR